MTPILRCPKCSGPHLDHDKVTVWDRCQDDETGLKVIVDDGAVTIDDKASMNDCPSSRRHALTVDFVCGNCDFAGSLVIAQHKGNTFLDWSNDEPLTIDNDG